MNLRRPTITLLAAIAAAALLPAAAAEAALVTPHEAGPQVVTPHAVTAPSAASPQAVPAPSAASGFSAPASAAPGGSHAPSLPGQGQQAIDVRPGGAAGAQRKEIQTLREDELFDWEEGFNMLATIHRGIELIVGPFEMDVVVPETVADRAVVPAWGKVIIVPGGQRFGQYPAKPSNSSASDDSSSPDGASPSDGGESADGDGSTPYSGPEGNSPGDDGSKPIQIDEPGSSKE